MTWEPVKIDKPYNPKGAIIGKPRKPLTPKKAPTHRDATLDELAQGCLERCPDRDSVAARLDGRRPKCKAPLGEHACVLAGAVPEGHRDPRFPSRPPQAAKPPHRGEHACSCGRRWA